MSVADALQLMLAFGTFTVTLTALIIELIKSQQKKGSRIFGVGKYFHSKSTRPFLVDELSTQVQLFTHEDF